MEQHFKIWELVTLALFLGSLTFILGAAFQTYIAYRNQKRFTFRIVLLVLLTRILTISATLLFWFTNTITIDMMFGPILLAALLPEMILSPILLKVFGYSFQMSKVK